MKPGIIFHRSLRDRGLAGGLADSFSVASLLTTARAQDRSVLSSAAIKLSTGL